jgi:hypothetical protein
MMRHVMAAGLLAAGLAQATLDAQADSWVLRVITRGGIMGNGAGEIQIASDGRTTCVAPRVCREFLAPESLRLLRAQIDAAQAAEWRQLPPGDICSDCQTTILELTRRHEDGTFSTVRASWDPVTRARLASDVTRVGDMARTAALSRP